MVDCAFGYPPYEILRCPTGKTHKRPVNHPQRKYSPLQNFGFVAFSSHLIPCQRGVSRSSRTRGELRWTHVTSARRVRRAGNRERKPSRTRPV
ncbi:hypothetical protein DCG74_24310 [Bradyrhizobium sp. WBAH42]|nr:hypothetical protein [Bradyrhizobium sp. WBAH30]MDD1546787.1 hypothetical protein [Bradyrhizobium sp. WBAH41]MDD1559504.1 hypothetical protein [Bradyrhizobium sp. WBAH23]MDD1567020.1 hypothetical protein [Bradyrhizobium sp. WBAH33]MDD1592099.1 hypothetical protein [Bradyrhizobium sp. WBAH42]NRB91493.1 hypothetical protein [Bradyrhizobium sp. WBAH10]QCJ91342.1 hypothetical protein DAA57_24760 [Bradyrhizobium yuanmingense]